MDVTEKCVIGLVKSAMTGEPAPLPDSFDEEAVYALICRHCIHALAFQGGLCCGLDRKSPLMQKLFRKYCQCTMVSERQRMMIQKLFDAFQQQHIDFMPVKGCNLMQLYPEPELRPMGDADILIRMEQYDRICPVMEALGFTFQLESDHELVWNHPQLEVELHKRLIPSYNEDYSAYYGDGWRLASRCEGSRYFMSDEDEFIYIFTHFAKHYRDGGIGVRHVADLWVFQQKHRGMKLSYIRQELEQLKLLEFYDNICQLVGFWFQGNEPSSKTEFLSAFMMNSGVWGTALNHTLSEGLRDAGQAGSAGRMRRKRWTAFVFPPLSVMREKYPVLQKYPLLLPLTWIHRDVGAALYRRRNFSSCLNKTRNMSDENISDYEKSLLYVGLEFGFEN